MLAWPAHDYAAWRVEQERMAHEVVVGDEHGPLRIMGGFDAAYSGRTGFGGLVVWDLASASVVETVKVAHEIDVPYVPGFLSYREFPILQAAWGRKRTSVDLLLVDGAGLMHPRHMGSASFAGLRLGVPTIGVTKNLFTGEVQGVVRAPGDAAPVVDAGRIIGHVLRTRPPPTRPIYVSPGHRVSVATALDVVRRVMGRHKLPEPLRLAHLAAAEAKAEHLAGG